MLVIISDLHLTDGTSGSTIQPGAFQIFADRLCETAERASWRADGRYQPIEGVELVLLGDVLDIIRSAQWLQSPTRPWDDPHSPEVTETVTTIVDRILTHNEPALSVLRALATEGAINVPAGDSRGRPLYESAAHTVPLRLHYMVGNHDWHLHLPGTAYDMIRQKVAQHMGLASRIDMPFPHDPYECEALLDAQRSHGVFARHGDIFDPINFEGDRDGSSLGDVIVVQLVNRFALEVQNKLSDELPEAAIAGLREIDNIRPLLLVPVWIDGLLDRTCSSLSTRKKVKRIWDELADEMLALPFVRDRDTWSPFDLVDGLSRALKFSKRASLDWSIRITDWMHKIRGAKSASFYSHALAEPDFRNRRAQHIVYGHTHAAESVPLDASYADSFVLNQVYFNSGTWRRVYRQTQLALGQHEFIPSETMSYLSFFQGDERGGCPFEAWNGMLGVDPAEGTNYRVDAPHARSQSLSPSNVQLRGPHFGSAGVGQTAAGASAGSRWVG